MNRNLVQKKNISLGLVYKGVGMSLNFLLVPILISFLDKEEYGVWITVFSIVNWIFTFDIGIGHGLRNKLTEALALNDVKKASSYISTAYFLMFIFALIILTIGGLLIYFIDFRAILNFDQRSNAFLKTFVFLSLFFTSINFLLSLYKKLYLAVHKSYVIELANSIFLALYIVCILSWNYFDLQEDLISLIWMFGTLNLIVSLVAVRIFFKSREHLKISYKLIDKASARALFNLGGGFFVINLCLLVILSTDNIIISNLLGPSNVTDYSVVQKLFQLLIIGFSVILASSWSLYSEALITKDYTWIHENLRKMNKYLLVVAFFGAILFFFINQILEIWLGNEVIDLPKGLTFYNLLYAVLFCFANIYFFFINSTGKIKLQMWLYVVGALINIPLSIYLVDVYNSSTGVIVSTIVCTIPLAIAMPIQSKHILKSLAKIN